MTGTQLSLVQFNLMSPYHRVAGDAWASTQTEFEPVFPTEEVVPLVERGLLRLMPAGIPVEASSPWIPGAVLGHDQPRTVQCEVKPPQDFEVVSFRVDQENADRFHVLLVEQACQSDNLDLAGLVASDVAEACAHLKGIARARGRCAQRYNCRSLAASLFDGHDTWIAGVEVAQLEGAPGLAR